MRLPKDPENWTGYHADKVLEKAWKEFDRYENRIDFEAPQEIQDDIYWPYQLARNLAVEVCTYTNWKESEARALP